MHTIGYFLFMNIDFDLIQHDITKPDKHIIAIIHTNSSLTKFVIINSM
jgi:hypothetical protein